MLRPPKLVGVAGEDFGEKLGILRGCLELEGKGVFPQFFNDDIPGVRFLFPQVVSCCLGRTRDEDYKRGK